MEDTAKDLSMVENDLTLKDWQMWEDCILSFLRSEPGLRGKFNQYVDDWNTHTKLPPSAYEREEKENCSKETYIVVKELPDANIGTKVLWDDAKCLYYYKKNAYVAPNDTAFLTAGQVTQTPEFFCKETKYPENFAYKNPVYSRKEILNLIKECFPDRSISGSFNISASKELYLFEDKLRALGKKNAETIIKKNRNHGS